LDPDALQEVFAMSSGNSIYVTGSMICDPYEQSSPTEVRRVVGNIGRAGISLLVAPPTPRSREIELGAYMHIEHATFDGQPEDSFRQTSIHLSFTDYEMPVRIRDESRHIIDRPANLVETLVSVYDRRSWVADLGVIKELSGRRHKNSDVINLQRLICKSANGRDTMTDCNSDPCKSIPDLVRFLETQYGYVFYPPMTSIDNWDELLDPPTNSICVVRAQKN